LTSSGKARFPGRGPVSFDAAQAWVDAAACLAAEPLALADAPGRVLAADCRAAEAIPGCDCAARDGFAVRAQESIGASAYNPVSAPCAVVAAGDALPTGTDAVVPIDHAELDGAGGVLLVEAVAPGENVEREGAVATAGAVLAPMGTRLVPRNIGMLALVGIGDVAVVRQPRVAVLLAGPTPSQGVPDSNGPMLRAAIARDGGRIVHAVAVERDRAALAAVLAAAEGDVVLVVGGTGPGPDDHSAAALTESGELAFHGIALRPGETAGLGRTAAGVMVVLLPGPPAACLWSYEMLAGRAIRRLGGRDPSLPFFRRMLPLARKLVSAIGLTEICPVRFEAASDTVEPLPPFAEIGLMAAVASDGFVIVPETSEGYPPGAAVTVHLYQDR
jgi:molybdopterin molybdotransferase